MHMPTRTHFDLTDDEFERQIAAGVLDVSLFNHVAHLRLAWIYISKYGIEAAINRISEAIKRFAIDLPLALP